MGEPSNAKLKKELIGAASMEMLLIGITAATGFLKAWGLFAGLAFLAVLFPLWVIAIAVVVGVYAHLPQEITYDG